MPNPKRTAEVRLLVVATIDLSDDVLAAALIAATRRPPSIAVVVADEIASNLESVSYVDAAIVSEI